MRITACRHYSDTLLISICRTNPSLIPQGASARNRLERKRAIDDFGDCVRNATRSFNSTRTFVLRRRRSPILRQAKQTSVANSPTSKLVDRSCPPCDHGCNFLDCTQVRRALMFHRETRTRRDALFPFRNYGLAAMIDTPQSLCSGLLRCPHHADFCS
jgi:hypothetical protein